MALPPVVESLLKTFDASIEAKVALVLAVVGVLAVLCLSLEFLDAFYRFFLRPSKNPAKLGKYAVITGATEGIGKAFAVELAKRGMSLVIIAHLENELQDTQKELMERFPKIDVKYIVVNYMNFDKAAQDKVAAALKDLSVGVLVNNVGQSYPFPEYYDKLPDGLVNSLLQLNIISTTYMTRIVLPKMVAQKSGAIVNMASAAAENPTPLLTQYSAVKSYIKRFSQSLNSEYKSQGITVHAHYPLMVTTRLSKIKRSSFTVPTPEVYVKCAIRFLGYEDGISPYWPHALQLWVMSKIPYNLLQKVVLSINLGTRKAALRKAEQKAK